MTIPLELTLTPPTFCWACNRCRPIDLSGCGPQCEEDQ